MIEVWSNISNSSSSNSSRSSSRRSSNSGIITTSNGKHNIIIFRTEPTFRSYPSAVSELLFPWYFNANALFIYIISDIFVMLLSLKNIPLKKKN